MARTLSTSRLTIGVLAAVVLALVAAPAMAQVQLVLPASSLPGLRPGVTSSAAARADLEAGLSRGAIHLISTAQVQASAARGSGRTVRSEAFVFGTQAEAASALSAWKRVHGARRGSFGYLAVRRHGATTVVTVAWREAARIGLIVLSASGRVHDPQGVAEGYAVLADGWLRSPAATTAWGRVLAQIRPDGSVSKATAEQAFVLAYGPLPGVRVPPGPKVAIPSGTLAEEWIVSYLRQLTSRQRQVVERKLGIALPTRLAHDAYADDPGFKPDSTIQAFANQFIPKYAALLGHPLGLTVIAGITTTVVKGPKGADALADATPFNAQDSYGSGVPASCRVRVTPLGDAQTSAYLQLIVAHEVFHCFQFEIRGSGAWSMPDAWITEGTADWAALTVDPVSYAIGGINITNYLLSAKTPLYQRAYDAVGFWGHAEDVFPGLFARMASILNAGSNDASFNLAIGFPDAFLSSWGSSPFRAKGIAGPAWQMNSPIDPPGYGSLPVAQTVTPSNVTGNTLIDAPPLTTAQYIVAVDPGEPLVHVQIDGHARLGLSTNYTDLQNAWFCVGGQPCVCPKGTSGQVPASLPLANQAALGVSGDPGAGSHGYLTSYSLSRFCEPNQPRPSPSSGNTGISNGDPYITTFDGAGYGFQTAGEFTLVKSITDNLEIQSRQVPYPSTLLASIAGSLAMNTAFAMRVGGAIVEVDKGSPLGLYIDRHRRFPAPGQTIRLPGGGRVRYGPTETTVTWKDGTRALLTSIGVEGVNIAVTPSPKRAGLLRGLLGVDDGQGDDDFIGRNGHRYAAKQIESVGLFVFSAAQRRIVLGGFGRSWRLTQHESLFVYPPGTNTNSYLVPGFPHVLVSLASFGHRRVTTAARVCRRAGVTNATLMVGCEIDYSATGSRLLATSTGTLQHAAGIHGAPTTSPGVSPIPWTQLSVQTDNDSPFLVPAVALADRAADTVVAAYARSARGSIESDTFHAGAGGIGAIARRIPFSGWIVTGIGDPVLFPSPGGGVQMIFSGLHSGDSGDPLNGTLIASRATDGGYGSPVLASSQVYYSTGGASGAVLASDGSTPLWVATQSSLAVYRGASGAVPNDLSAQAPGRSYNPALAYDSSGRLWLAWYMTPMGSSQTGLYMMQLNPATGVAAGPSLHVPSSDGINQLDEGRPALACEQICRVVYEQGTQSANLLSWAPGDPSPTLVFAGTERIAGTMPSSPIYPHSPTAAYTADGRLWVAWRDTVSYLKMYAKLGNATGAGGSVVTLQVPAKDAVPQYSSSLTVGDSLVVVANWAPGNLAATSVWATVVNPG